MDLFEKQAQLQSLFQTSPVDAAYAQGTVTGRRIAGTYQDLDIALLLLSRVNASEFFDYHGSAEVLAPSYKHNHVFVATPRGIDLLYLNLGGRTPYTAPQSTVPASRPNESSENWRNERRLCLAWTTHCTSTI